MEDLEPAQLCLSCEFSRMKKTSPSDISTNDIERLLVLILEDMAKPLGVSRPLYRKIRDQWKGGEKSAV
ncbi:hypothetical protein NC652_025992 [Populus alba x Populus x berolinensis]|nr:hypothetical protein NC652_025992 [Populus alba x Populus x berolinensis]